MNNGYPATNHNNWPYIAAQNYNDWNSILQAFPHLKEINQPLQNLENKNVVGIVIRSANDDNVHKAIKYGIWTTTPKNKSKIELLWAKKLNQNTDTYLFFSAVKSGMFEGVARLKSGYHEQSFPYWWENYTLKFKGYFELEWVYIKDINNKHFAHLYNVENEEVVKSKDCDIIDGDTTVNMLNIFNKKLAKRSIFVDFAFMDEREFQYIRKMYETQHYYSQFSYGNNSFDLSQFSLVGHPLNLINGVNNTATIPPVVGLPPMLMKPGNEQQRSNLGFQMNPVSKNKKK